MVSVHKVEYEEKTTASLKNKPCTSEKCNDSEDEKLQLKTIHQTIPSVMEQSLNNSSYDPSFFHTHIPIHLIRFAPLTPLDEDTILNCQKNPFF